ncbi:hypothetical protein NDU88_003894 [Pleurodeles waltl]|uniref:Uncharacterized protein n=1 Tax=Pleurodeles waltl TaxID=8319 RepID=A0AAV7UDT8_PLEWA|nr:hypothetical protein NDU88_003894 [Pleurodeles waltl]
MDRMSEHIDKHSERLDHVEDRVSVAEDGQTELAGGQMKLNRELSALKLKGLNDARKTRKVIAYLRNHKVDISILQVTHLAPDSPFLTPRRLQGQFVVAEYTSHSRGVLIEASREMDIGLRLVTADPGGRYVVACCNVQTFSFLLIGIHGPNYDDPQFYRELALRANSWGGQPQHWCGDFNCTLDPSLDRRQLQQLESDLSQLERDHSDTADARILGHVHTKIQEYQETAHTEIQHLGKYITARVYGEGDRPGAVLVGLVRPQRGKNTIVTIQSEGGEEIKDPERIADRFREYYQSLYSSRVNPNPEAVADYLTHIAMPPVPQADRDALSAPLTLGEISEALGGMAEGKAPGPDGLKVYFYKAYQHLLLPKLKDVYEEMVKNDNCLAQTRETQ